MNYFYMQVLQGSCVGNKQFNCIAPKRVEFLDICRSFHKRPMVYKMLLRPQSWEWTGHWSIAHAQYSSADNTHTFILVSDICWMWATSQQRTPSSAVMIHERVPRDPGTSLYVVTPLAIACGFVHVCVLDCWVRTLGPAQNNTIHHLFQTT